MPEPITIQQAFDWIREQSEGWHLRSDAMASDLNVDPDEIYRCVGPHSEWMLTEYLGPREEVEGEFAPVWDVLREAIAASMVAVCGAGIYYGRNTKGTD